MKRYPKNHPYSRSLDEVLSHYFVTRTDVPAAHGEEYEEMKELILEALFHSPRQPLGGEEEKNGSKR